MIASWINRDCVMNKSCDEKTNEESICTMVVQRRWADVIQMSLQLTMSSCNIYIESCYIRYILHVVIEI